MALYDESMRRVLQIAVFLLLVSAFALPLMEFFDRWDTAGLDNDTEFAFFGFVLLLALVLLICELISVISFIGSLGSIPYSPPRLRVSFISGCRSCVPIACASPPLRI